MLPMTMFSTICAFSVSCIVACGASELPRGPAPEDLSQPFLVAQRSDSLALAVSSPDGTRVAQLGGGGSDVWGQRGWFRSPGTYELVLTDETVDSGAARVTVPLQLRGDEMLVAVTPVGHVERVEVDVWVTTDPARLRQGSTLASTGAIPLEIMNAGVEPIRGLGYPDGWFHALWLRVSGQGVERLPTPRHHCATGIMFGPTKLDSGSVAPAGVSPWAMGGAQADLSTATHVLVPFSVDGLVTPQRRGKDGRVQWRVRRQLAASLPLATSISRR